MERMITGQNVAAIPDQPKITNQNTVRSGERTDTVSATPSANSAKPSVIFFEKFISHC